MLCYSPWTVRLMNLESSPASLETTHSYTAVSSTVGAITIREPDDSNLEITKKFIFDSSFTMMSILCTYFQKS